MSDYLEPIMSLYSLHEAINTNPVIMTLVSTSLTSDVFTIKLKLTDLQDLLQAETSYLSLFSLVDSANFGKPGLDDSFNETDGLFNK